MLFTSSLFSPLHHLPHPLTLNYLSLPSLSSALHFPLPFSRIILLFLLLFLYLSRSLVSSSSISRSFSSNKNSLSPLSLSLIHSIFHFVCSLHLFINQISTSLAKASHRTIWLSPRSTLTEQRHQPRQHHKHASVFPVRAPTQDQMLPFCWDGCGFCNSNVMKHSSNLTFVIFCCLSSRTEHHWVTRIEPWPNKWESQLTSSPLMSWTVAAPGETFPAIYHVAHTTASR